MDKFFILNTENPKILHMEKYTLRIKKIYFDAIKDGSKSYEYRAFKDYYKRLFKNASVPFLLNLHYQGAQSLVVLVDKIVVCRTPKSVDRSVIPTSRCYRLRLQPFRDAI